MKNIWLKIKEFFRSDLDKQLDDFPTAVYEAKIAYVTKLKSMNQEELLREICYLLKF